MLKGIFGMGQVMAQPEIGEKTRINLSAAVVTSAFLFLIGGAVGSLSMAKAYGVDTAKTDARITALEKESAAQGQSLEAIKKGFEQMNLMLARIDERLARRP
jgi:hypothetical protein